MIKIPLAAALTAAFALPSLAGQNGSATFAVVVVYKEAAPLANFRVAYRADERMQANPDAWAYLDAGVVGATQAFERAHGFRAEHVYSNAINGFSARLSARQIQAIENDALVDYVEADGVVTTNAQTLPWGIDRIDADLSTTKAGNGNGTVANVNVYVIDTGVWGHADINKVGHVNFAGGINNDCHGHGTHVAGTVAARDNTSDVVGVVPGAPVTGVKVLACNGSGTTSGVIKGIDWVTANAKKPAVANMSLGGGASTALDDAVKRSANSGVFFAVAAGNDGADACTKSPARAGTHNGVMTVAATDSTNNDPSWSNFGPCVDVWAPGASVLSTKINGGTTTMSGTSMASPHAAGTGALFLSNNIGSTPAAVEAQLKSNLTTPGTTSNGGQAIKLLNAANY